MTWDGDISQMGQLVERLSDLAEVPSRAAKRVSRDIAELIQEEFDDGEDPYGDPWAPLAPATIAKGRHAPPLTDTGKMRGSLRVAPMRGSGVAITIDHPAAPHQTGWDGTQSKGPARPILPARGELPPSWQEAIENAVEQEIGRVRRRA